MSRGGAERERERERGREGGREGEGERESQAGSSSASWSPRLKLTELTLPHKPRDHKEPPRRPEVFFKRKRKVWKRKGKGL